MLNISLHQGWKFTDTAPGAGDPNALARVDYDDAGWLAVDVPGDIHAALTAAGRIPDPFLDDRARQAFWITGRDWWWRLVFKVAREDQDLRTDLCLDGVDGHADLFLNGRQLGQLRNAFRPHRFDIRGCLHEEEYNVLLLRFHAIDGVMGRERDAQSGCWPGRRVLMRKPQFNFGWDWSLPLPGTGVMGAISIERYPGPRLLDAGLRTFLSGRVDFHFQVNQAARDAGYELALRVWGHGVDLRKQIKKPGRVYSYTSIQIEQPKLWWPHGSGSAELYDYSVELLVNGATVERRAGRFGIREIRLVEDPFTDEAGPGLSFWLEVNGRRIFCKGANWVPLEIWPSMAADDAYRFYVERTADAHFNMLRVWGGGIYERELFYDLCDQHGIMVWQDFMFASGGYPVDLLRPEIIAEAEYQIRRLRNRACLAIWCGCNEDAFSWALPDEKAAANADTGVYNDPETERKANRLRDDPQIYTMILRGLISRLGNGASYVESSPQSHDDFGNLPESGNSHLSCWKYALFQSGPDGAMNDKALAAGQTFALAQSGSRPERFRNYFEQVCSFDSEFCIQGPADLATIRRFLSAANHWPPNDVWTFHVQRGHAHLPHHEQTLFIAGALFGEIDSLEKYVKHGQATHAEMMRAEFESARRDYPNNGGTMFWMLNDCWPTSNWSAIDYYRRPKPAYYAAKRACAPYLPILFERRGMIECFFSNHSAAACQAELTLGRASLAGRAAPVGCHKVAAAPGATVRLAALERATLQLEADEFLFVDAVVGGRRLPRITYFPQLWKDVPWPSPCVRVVRRAVMQKGALYVTKLAVTSDVYARFCHLIPPTGAQPYWLNDNFYDLCGGCEHEVEICAPHPVEPESLRIGHWHTEWP